MAKVRDDKDIVEMFEAQYTRSEDKFSNVKKNWKEDNDFSLGEQWDEISKNLRTQPGQERPCLTVNKIDPLVHRIVNEAKQQKLEAKVKPVDDVADPDAAIILAGLVRNTEYVSNAVRAYMWAYECAVRAGVGYFKVVNEYESDDSFEQTVRIKRIKNPLCVSFDPDADQPNGSDATYGIVSEGISAKAAEDLLKEYKESKEIIIPNKEIWGSDESEVKHGEIWWQEQEPDELFLLKDNSVVRKSDITKEALDFIKNTPGMIVKSRSVNKNTIKYSELCDGKVLQTLDTNSKYIPLVRMIGREGYINEKIDFRGITRNSMDSNRMYNVMSSLLIERVGLAPRAPYIGAAGQFEGYEDQWQNANTKNYAKLEYNPITIGGNLAPPPQKNDASSGDPTIERYMMIASKDIQDESAMSDAFMGNRSNETSGAGIKARSAQSSTATYDFFDNCSDAIEHGARICIDMYPRILRKDQVIRIIGDDNKQRVIKMDAFEAKDGKVKPIDLTLGKFDVEISVSSGDKTRRETAIEQLSFVLQTNPEAASLIMDVFVGNLDIKDADKIAKRFKAMLPPKVIAAEEENEKDNPELDALQAHAEEIISQLKAQLEEIKAALQDAELKLKIKDGELNIKQQEVDLKKDELKLKEVEVFAKIEQDKVDGENEGKEEGPAHEKKETKKEEKSEDEIDHPTQIQYIINKMQQDDEEMVQIHKQLDIIADILEKLQGGNGNAPQVPTQPENATTQGNGLPPAEAENNVGAI